MGLDTTHDCFRGPYSIFMRWRMYLHTFTAPNKSRSLEEAWQAGDYNDQSKPVNVLMNHSDCDGEISADVCGPLADALQAILEQMPETSGPFDDGKTITKRFIGGLRRAAEANETVIFH